MGNREVFMYVSSWNEHGGVPGLGRYTVDQERGEITFLEMISETESCNASQVDDVRGKLYVNNEVPCFPGAPYASGRIFIYDLDPHTGRAKEAGRLVTECPNPAYLSIDSTGQYLFEAHHSLSFSMARHSRGTDGIVETSCAWPEADVQVYRLDKDGMPAELVENIDHAHDCEAHPHSAVVSPSGRLLAVADKGTGYLYLYTFDYEKKQMILLNKMLTDREGASPRYVLFHPEKPFLFVNHEASYDGKCYVTAFRYREDGQLERICVVNALDQSLPVKTDTRLEQQGFVMDRTGTYLYTLINAADVIGVLRVDQEDGSLEVLQNLPVPGVRPRGLAIFPNGKYILSSCLVGGELTVYRIEKDGRLRVHRQGPKQPGASYMSFYQPGI